MNEFFKGAQRREEEKVKEKWFTGRNSKLTGAENAHMGTNAKTISEIARAGEKKLRLRVAIKKNELEIKYRRAMPRRFWAKIISAEVYVLEVGGGFTKAVSERKKHSCVKTKAYLEELFEARRERLGLEVGSAEILNIADAVLMREILRGRLRVRGEMISWVPESFRSSEHSAFLVNDPVRLPRAVGRIVKEAPSGFWFEILCSRTQKVSEKVSTLPREPGTSEFPWGRELNFILRAERAGNSKTLHPGDVQTAAFQPADSDWLLG